MGNTNMTRHEKNTFKYCLVPGLQKPCPYTPPQGAAVVAYCAVGDAQPGSWYKRRAGCTVGTVAMSGFTESMRPELYRRSRQWVGLEPLLGVGRSHLLV